MSWISLKRLLRPPAQDFNCIVVCSVVIMMILRNICSITTFLSNCLRKLIEIEKKWFQFWKILFASIYSFTKISSNVSVPHPCDKDTSTSLTREWKSSGCNHFINLILRHGKYPLVKTSSYEWKCNVTEMTQWNWIARTCTGPRKLVYLNAFTLPVL